MFDISTLGLNKITQEECTTLEEPVTQMEVRKAMLSCGPSKAPGYDGFNLKCIRHVWPIIGEECSKFILQFFDASGMCGQSLVKSAASLYYSSLKLVFYHIA